LATAAEAYTPALSDSTYAARSNGRSPSGSTRGQSLAQGLGWFSIGLGLAQVIAPRRMADLIGVEDSDRNATLMRAMGVREIASGIGIFSQRNDSAFLWGRVMGDALDLALLGAAMTSGRNDRNRLIGAVAAVAGATALDVLVARQRSNPEHTEMVDDSPIMDPVDGVRVVRKSITINASQEQVSDALERMVTTWDDLRQLRDAEVSLCAGPSTGETEVRAAVTWDPRLGTAGAAAAKLAHRDPASQLHRELRHLKQLVEVGEVVHSDASIHRGPHPAQPDPEARVR
jgi:uncharacterized membrane protein